MEAEHIFKYDILLKSDIDYFRRCIYTNIDFYEKFQNKYSSEEDEWNKMQIVEMKSRRYIPQRKRSINLNMNYVRGLLMIQILSQFTATIGMAVTK